MILIGELRDAETAQTALQAAESGHLVLSTLHTIDAAETVGRMVEFFPAEKQQQIRSILAGVLRGVVSQRLLPRVDGGRVAAVEVMVNNARIADLIREDRADEIHEAIAEGAFFQMQTFTQALIELVARGRGRPRDRGERRDEPARLPRRARPGREAQGDRPPRREAERWPWQAARKARAEGQPSSPRRTRDPSLRIAPRGLVRAPRSRSSALGRARDVWPGSLGGHVRYRSAPRRARSLPSAPSRTPRSRSPPTG